MTLSMIILDARYELFNTADKSGTTPLMLAASHGWEDLVMALLEAGSRRGDVDKNGRTAGLCRGCRAIKPRELPSRP